MNRAVVIAYGGIDEVLAQALEAAGAPADQIDLSAEGGREARHRAAESDLVVLAAALPSKPPPSLEAVQAAIEAAFGVVKAAVSGFKARGADGRIVLLLPQDAAMGRPADPANSAITGAMLSLSRTVALELRKTGGTINAVMHDLEASPAAASAVAAQIVALALPAMTHLTGQEIFIAHGEDVGRLHP
jgi:NAD(P)-dependent dehydrogenase (short-subunit alcohol dehydrogenase family)